MSSGVLVSYMCICLTKKLGVPTQVVMELQRQFR